MNKEAKPAQYGELYLWMRSFVIMMLLILGLITFVGTPIGVQNISMMPTLYEHDRMIVRTIFYTPDRGDIVVLSRYDFEDGAALVKRVIALEGEVVDIDTNSGLVYVNGVALHEPYVSEPTWRVGNIGLPFTVPAGHVFVLGDNRNRSMDSRDAEIGAVDEREIIGQVVAVYLPLNRARLFLR